MTEQLAWDEQGVQWAWDATSIKNAELCLQYYGYLADGWTPIRKSVHLLFGGHFAKGLERYYKLVAEGKSSNDALIDTVWQALIDTWEYEIDENGHSIPGTGTPWASDHPSKTRENLVRTLVWYVDQYENNMMELVKLPDNRAAVEYSFTLEVKPGLMFSGHIDRLVTYSGDLYIMDQKTTGNTITPKFFEQFDLDSQMDIYTFAGKIIYDMPIKGVVVDGAQIAVGFTRFERGFTHRTNSQLEEWLEDTLALIDKAQRATAEGRYPRNRSSCSKYGGCMFRGVCSKSPEFRDNFLRADFKQGKRWNPLEQR